jgi:RNA polymerase sigma factor (sigma-70 family)
MNEPLAKVYVVDDDPSVRKSLARLLRSAGYQTETFSTAREFLDYRRVHDTPGPLVLDVEMPGASGLELQSELLDSPNPIPIIFITGHGDIPMSVTAMKAGAVDFLSKPFQDEDLLAAIREASASGRRKRAEYAERAAIQELYEKLTAREREVMAMVVCGLPNKQIASRLGIVEKTIKVHRGRVMSKMQASSVAELVRAALKIGIRPEPAANATSIG